jgi:hypothetical protein
MQSAGWVCTEQQEQWGQAEDITICHPEQTTKPCSGVETLNIYDLGPPCASGKDRIYQWLNGLERGSRQEAGGNRQLRCWLSVYQEPSPFIDQVEKRKLILPCTYRLSLVLARLLGGTGRHRVAAIGDLRLAAAALEVHGQSASQPC